MFILSASSEVLPAVLDSEMGVDVLEWSPVLMGVVVHVDLGPLDGVAHIWEVGSPIGMVLDGLGNTVVEPVHMVIIEVVVCFVAHL